MSTTAKQTEQTLRVIPLVQLHESKHNPRRHFDDDGLKALSANILKVGILNPLLVRPNASGFEIAAGHRRYRASKLAKLESVPCVVRPLTDEQFMEVLTIDNLQREDVHPLDEAKGYEALMAPPYRWKVEMLADKVGKSTKYIYDSKKLLDLNKEAQELFWANKIDKGHAILLARLTNEEQAKVIGTKKEDYDDGGLFVEEFRLYDTDEEQEAAYKAGPQVKARSVREVEAWIKEHIRFNAKRADPVLFPETVAQVQQATETKRKIIEITHEYLAGDDVRSAGEARIYGERAWKRADGKDGSKACEYAVLGVIASGPGQGQAFNVCIRKDKCLVHWGAEIRAREKSAKASAKGETGGKDKWKLEQEKREAQWKREREERDRKEAQWKKALPDILKVTAERIKTMPIKAAGDAGDLLCQFVSNNARGKSDAFVKRGTTAEDLVRYALFLGLHEQAHEWDGWTDFPKLAGQIGINLKPILAKHAPKDTPAVQTTADKKKGKAA